MAVEFELPVLQISMAAVDKMQGPDALRALWTVFTKTTSALQDGPRLENMTWRLWHRQLLLDRLAAVDDAVAAPVRAEGATIEVVSEGEDDSGGEWEDDSAPPSRDPTIQPPTATHADKTGVSTRRQSSTTTQRPVPNSTLRSRRLSCDPLVLSISQPTPSSRPTLTPESRCNSSPVDGTHYSHGPNIGRIISNLLPEKLEVAAPSSSMSHPSVLATSQGDDVPSTPKTQPVQLLIQSPSTPPDVSDSALAHLPPTLMVITPTPRPTPPATPSTRARAVPTNIPSALLPGVPPLALNAPSTLDHPHSVLLPCPSATEQLVPAAALPLTPLVSAPDLADDDSKKKIFYVQSPEGATASDDGRSHSSSSNSNTTSNVTDAHAVLSGQQASSLSSTTTNEPASAYLLPEAASPTAHVSGPRGTNHARTSSGNAAYIRPRAAKGAKATKSAARVTHRGRTNALTRTISNSSDKSRGGGGGKPKTTRQHSVSEEVVEDIEEIEGENKQTSASTSQTVTSLPRAPAAPSLNMTPAAKSPERPRNNTPASRVVSSPAIMRQTPASVRSPPNVLAPAALVAPFTTIASVAPTTHAQQAPNEAPRPPVNNNSSALMGLGRRAVHVETSSDLESESEVWSDDETDSEDPLAQAANEASRQRSMFEKVPPKPLPRQVQRTGLLTNLMNPDPRVYPQAAALRQHNSAQNLAAVRRGAPTVLQTSRSTVAVPMAAAVTAEQVTTHVSVDPKGRAVGTSESRPRGSRGLRLKGRPEGDVDEEGSTDEENSMPNELSKTYAQQRLEALARKARVPPPPPMEQVRHGQAPANAPPANAPPSVAPRPAPQPQATVPYDMDVRPIHSPRTVRRKMIAGELSESLRRNLMWERTSTRFAMGAGAIGSGLRPLTDTRPGVQTTNSDRGLNGGSRSGDEDSQERSEARRLALARNKSWANDFHHAGW